MLCLPYGKESIENIMGNSIMQGLWIGDRLSLLEQLSVKSFMSNGHEYHLYIYDHVKNIPSGVVIKNANEIISKKDVYQSEFLIKNKLTYCGFSDYFRFKLLLDKGGFWTDLDVICLKHFDFKDDYIFCQDKSQGMTKIDTSIIKCPKNNNMIKEIYEYIKKNPIKTTEKGKIIPFLGKMVYKYKLEKYAKKVNVFCSLPYTQLPKLVYKGFDIKDYENSYSVHVWNQMTDYLKEGLLNSEKRDSFENKLFSKSIIDKNKKYPSNTLLGSWQDMYL